MRTFTDTQKLACDISRNIAITAGAGSGKTSVLVERYVWCLRNNGHQVSRIVAITFTEKAAGQMLGRIRERIAAYASTAVGDARLWETVLERLPLANIATIHGFCQRLLKEFPIEAGVDPGFDVLDESVRMLLLDRLIDQGVQERSAAHDADLATLAELWSPFALKQVLLELFARRDAALPWARRIMEDTCDEYVERSAQFANALLRQGVDRIARSAEWQQAIEEIRGLIPPGDTSKLSGRCRNVLEYDAEFRTQARLDDQVLTLKMLDNDCRMVTPNAAWKAEGRRERLKAAFLRLRALYAEWLPAITLNVEVERSAFAMQQALAPLFLDLYARYEQEKAERRRLDFDDLQEKALALLQQPATHEVVRQRYDFVMVDEFQDTNQLQWELIQQLGATPQGLAGNTFCIVGDEKQSIYMFRGAEVAVFHEVRQQLRQVNAATGSAEADHRLPQLGEPPAIRDEQRSGELVMAENFRSDPAVLFFLNALFAQIFLPEWDPERPFHVPHQALRPGKKSSSEEPPAEAPVGAPALEMPQHHLPASHLPAAKPAPVEFLLVEPPSDEKAATTTPLTEPELVALRIKELTAHFRYIDMAILLRTRTRLKDFEEALRHQDIPFVVTGGIGFFQQQEIYDLANLLRVLVDPRQDIALTGVLRSPLFGFSDERVLFLRTPPPGAAKSVAALPLWQQLAYHAAHAAAIPPELEPEQFVTAHQRLRAWKRLVDNLPITQLVRRILDDTGLPGIIAADQREAQIRMNIDKLLDVARNFEQEGFQTLHDFVEMLEQLIELEERESEAQISTEGMNVVRLMTIHAAKGLEFPVVFVPELERPFNYGLATSAYVDQVDTGAGPQPVVGIKGLLPDQPGAAEDTVFRTYLQRRAREKTDAEMQRLLYVACTRAERHLFLSADWSKPAPASSWLAWLAGILPLEEALSRGEVTITDPEQPSYAPQTLTIPVRTSGAYAGARPAPRRQPDLLPEFQAVLRPAAANIVPAPDDAEIARLKRRMQPARGAENAYVRISPSTVHELFVCPRKYYYGRMLKLPETLARTDDGHGEIEDDNGRMARGHAGGRERGTLLHRLFEERLFDRDLSESALLDAANALLDRMGVPARVRRDMELERVILQAARHYDRSGLRELVATAAPVYRERAFALRIGQLDVSGTLDALLWDAEGRQWKILDYKSNDIAADGVEAEIAKHRYDIQMQLYALAVARILRTDAVGSVLFFTVPGVVYDAVDVSEPARQRLLEAITSRLAALRAGDLAAFEPSPGACADCGYGIYGGCGAASLHLEF